VTTPTLATGQVTSLSVLGEERSTEFNSGEERQFFSLRKKWRGGGENDIGPVANQASCQSGVRREMSGRLYVKRTSTNKTTTLRWVENEKFGGRNERIRRAVVHHREPRVGKNEASKKKRGRGVGDCSPSPYHRETYQRLETGRPRSDIYIG